MKLFYLVAALLVLICTDAVEVQGKKAESKKGFQLTNEFRQKSGKKAQKWSDELYMRAMEHNRFMAKQDKLSHANFGPRVKALGQKGLVMVGENCTYSHKKAGFEKDMVDRWIKSSGHKQNMLADKEYGATAFLTKDGKTWGTQLFANKAKRL